MITKNKSNNSSEEFSKIKEKIIEELTQWYHKMKAVPKSEIALRKSFFELLAGNHLFDITVPSFYVKSGRKYKNPLSFSRSPTFDKNRINFDRFRQENQEKYMDYFNDILNSVIFNESLLKENKSIQLDIIVMSSRIEEIKEKYEELDDKRITLLEELETESFKPKIRKIQHELSEICWKMDELEQQRLNIEFDIDTTFFFKNSNKR
ncbi:MAG: hypothetical protein ACTSXH_19340 [Promethearchaeota archaeon]